MSEYLALNLHRGIKYGTWVSLILLHNNQWKGNPVLHQNLTITIFEVGPLWRICSVWLTLIRKYADGQVVRYNFCTNLPSCAVQSPKTTSASFVFSVYVLNLMPFMPAAWIGSACEWRDLRNDLMGSVLPAVSWPAFTLQRTFLVRLSSA